MKVITANRLLDGEVVWLGPNGNWVEVLTRAEILEEPSHVEDALKTAEHSEKAQEVVGAYEIDVVRDEGRILPAKLKEMIRAAGPTTKPDLGKQARAS
ncbi:DUF2849 domain-containing protein [Rhodobacteraceae bacterium RKSG542]|uniref:DUF2849 domain-containing protein n=1 Tax=Pseudovibrio flavus TaxID=2529854 RepID=UPI0012BD0B57|nr:DUF2849 domain-containing protein [Pseudovibrio flavus]MTI17083.1 DUF2849 domain-containing protein [Pseudovibrio flavus]